VIRTGPGFQPPPEALVRQIAQRSPNFWREFMAGLDRATAGVEVVVTSWYRSAADNVRVGGAVNSQHRYATAFDLAGPFLRTSARNAVASRLRAQSFFVLDEGDHLHVQAFPAGALSRAGVRPG